METSLFKQEEQSQNVLILCSMASNLGNFFLSLFVYLDFLVFLKGVVFHRPSKWAT